MAQGTLFSLDRQNDIFSFLHETLQEYLTAEYILENPVFLKNIDKNEHSNWEMPLVYAFEIEPEPAVELCNTISKVNYFLAALVLNEKFLHTLRLPENLSHFMKATLSVLNLTALDDRSITYKQTDIPVISSNTIKYVTKTNNLSINRFKKITAFWKEKTSNNSLLGLCSLDILVLTDDKIRELLPSLSSYHSAISLVESGLATKEDFQDRIPQWCKKASVKQATSLVESGWATKEDLLKHIFNATIAIHFVESGWATKEDFQDRIPQWNKKKTSVKQIINLLESGLATKEDFQNRILQWCEKASVKQATSLVESGWAAKDDFQDKIPQWCKKASVEQASRLVESGWATKDDFQDKIPQWCEKTSVKQFARLVETGWATKDDFQDRIPQCKFNLFFKTVSFKNAKRAVNVGLATWNDILQYTENEKTKQKIIDQGLLKVEKNAPPSQKP